MRLVFGDTKPFLWFFTIENGTSFPVIEIKLIKREILQITYSGAQKPTNTCLPSTCSPKSMGRNESCRYNKKLAKGLAVNKNGARFLTGSYKILRKKAQRSSMSVYVWFLVNILSHMFSRWNKSLMLPVLVHAYGSWIVSFHQTGLDIPRRRFPD